MFRQVMRSSFVNGASLMMLLDGEDEHLPQVRRRRGTRPVCGRSSVRARRGHLRELLLVVEPCRSRPPATRGGRRSAKIFTFMGRPRELEPLVDEDRERVGLLPGPTPATQTRRSESGFLRVRRSGIASPLQPLERLAVAEEPGDPDQEVAVETRSARPSHPQLLDVAVQIDRVAERQPARSIRRPTVFGL